jgi:hypothetical protein
MAVAVVLQGPSGPFADSATAALIARARARHRQQDAAVQDYEAVLRTRLDAEAGRGAFARLIPLAVEEQESRLSWQAPNDVKVVILGRRFRTAFRNVEINSGWTQPWFVPRFLGDSIRLLSSDGFPERAAVHPLSAGADAYYRYAIDDSMQLVLPGRTVRAIGVRVTPTRADASLIAGELWLDATTAETVRLSMVFVGKRLWSDSIGPTRRDTVRADRQGAFIERILRVSADLEYGLYDARYWLPYRQAVTLEVRVPWILNVVVPVHFTTTFRDVRVNQGAAIAFATPPLADTAGETGRRHRRERRWCGDSTGAAGDRAAHAGAPCVSSGTWTGGRYEVDTPSDSVLRRYAGWTDSLRFDLSAADRERLDALRIEVRRLFERLPDSLTGRTRLAVAFDRVTDIFRYNRAEGVSLGWGYAWRPGASYVTALGKIRYAFTDRRLQASLTLRHDGVASRLEMTGYREMRDADPLAPGLTFSNSMTALWLARDDGAYYFAQGGEVHYLRPLGAAADLAARAGYEDETAPRRLAHSGLNDWLGGRGAFPVNAPVRPGHFALLALELTGGRRSFGWRAGLEATTGTRNRGRGWLAATARTPRFWGLDVTASGWLGAGLGDSLPQRDFRLGGEKTLRGYPAGAFRGMSAWAIGVDLAWWRRGWPVTPVVFADAGQIAVRRLRFDGQPAASLGVGLSVLGGAVRLDAARPVAPKAPWRFTLQVGARR